MFTEGPCLAQYAKDKKMMTTDASKTGLGITLRQKQDSNLGFSVKYQLPNSHNGKLKTLTEPGQEIQINFTGKLRIKKNWRRTNFDSDRSF